MGFSPETQKLIDAAIAAKATAQASAATTATDDKALATAQTTDTTAKAQSDADQQARKDAVQTALLAIETELMADDATPPTPPTPPGPAPAPARREPRPNK